MNDPYRQRHLREMSRPDDACIFYEGWQGYCEGEVTAFTSFCEDHLEEECWSCGQQAFKTCAIQECETVECEDHPHYKEH